MRRSDSPKVFGRALALSFRRRHRRALHPRCLSLLPHSRSLTIREDSGCGRGLNDVGSRLREGAPSTPPPTVLLLLLLFPAQTPLPPYPPHSSRICSEPTRFSWLRTALALTHSPIRHDDKRRSALLPLPPLPSFYERWRAATARTTEDGNHKGMKKQPRERPQQ